MVEEEKLLESPLNKDTLISIKKASFGWRQDINCRTSKKGDWMNNYY